MSTFHGKSGVVKIGSDAIAKVQNWTYTETVALADNTGMGDTYMSYLSGMRDPGGNIDALFDPDDAGQGAIAYDSDISLVLYPEGETTGDYALTGNVRVAEVTKNAGKDSLAAISFSFKGGLTEGTVP